MILKISQKTNINGWRRQAIIDIENRSINVGSFLFAGGDVEKLTATQFNQMIEYFTGQGFKYDYKIKIGG